MEFNITKWTKVDCPEEGISNHVKFVKQNDTLLIVCQPDIIEGKEGINNMLIVAVYVIYLLLFIYSLIYIYRKNYLKKLL
jgi:hypothetical protein